MKKYSIFLTIVILCGCSKILCPAPDLRTSRQGYSNNTIRLDGIYYVKNSNQQVFLYRNGIFHTGCRDVNSKSIPEKFQCSLDYISEAKKDRAQWGIYIVNGNSIYLEYWGLIKDCEYDVFSYNGKILNDTTLLIPTDRNGVVLDTFHFAKFSPKPDSTNNFIK